MTARELTCVVCPNGCAIVVEMDDDETPVVARIRGGACKRGQEWARQEVENPMRTLSSSVQVRDGDCPLASVRTSRPVPLAMIRPIMEEIGKAVLDAPVALGDLVLSRPSGCDTEIVATRNVGKVRQSGRG